MPRRTDREYGLRATSRGLIRTHARAYRHVVDVPHTPKLAELFGNPDARSSPTYADAYFERDDQTAERILAILARHDPFAQPDPNQGRLWR